MRTHMAELVMVDTSEAATVFANTNSHYHCHDGGDSVIRLGVYSVSLTHNPGQQVRLCIHSQCRLSRAKTNKQLTPLGQTIEQQRIE